MIGENACVERALGFIAGRPGLAQLIREHHWSTAPLRPVETWPEPLRMTLALCLA